MGNLICIRNHDSNQEFFVEEDSFLGRRLTSLYPFEDLLSIKSEETIVENVLKDGKFLNGGIEEDKLGRRINIYVINEKEFIRYRIIKEAFEAMTEEANLFDD